MGSKYQLKWSLRWALYRSTYWRVNKFWRFGKSSYKIMTDNSFASQSPLFGMIFVNWFLFSSSVENLGRSLRCCNNLIVHFNQFFCVSGPTCRFQFLYQINRKDLNEGKCVKADDNAGNIYMRTGQIDSSWEVSKFLSHKRLFFQKIFSLKSYVKNKVWQKPKTAKYICTDWSVLINSSDDIKWVTKVASILSFEPKFHVHTSSNVLRFYVSKWTA